MDTPRSVILDGTWSLTFGAEGAGPGHPDRLAASGWPTIPAPVPGRVEEALVAAGLEPDPQVGRNAWRFAAYEHHEWWYQREVEVPELPIGHRWRLVFDGIDCLGTVWVDGNEVGRTANMFIAHHVEVELAPGRHRLAVRLGSAINEARRHEPAIGGFSNSCSWESWRMRKAAHQYGWDILPRLVSAGLWRGVRLEPVAVVGVRSTYWTTTAVDAEKRTAKAVVAWTFDLPATPDWSACSWRLVLERGGRTVLDRRGPVVAYHGRAQLDLADVDLWWPRGWGEAALHRATVELIAGDGRVLGRRSEEVGFRTVVLQRSEATTTDGQGDFAFIVNGRRLYARGRLLKRSRTDRGSTRSTASMRRNWPRASRCSSSWSATWCAAGAARPTRTRRSTMPATGKVSWYGRISPWPAPCRRRTTPSPRSSSTRRDR